MERILLVDDEPSIISVLGTLLKAEGYEVTPALGGAKGKELLMTQEFDLMISDIRMKPINGMELLRLVHDERPTVSVIMLTAYGSVETAIEALKLGAFDYITKPFKVDELLITVRRSLNYSRTLNENRDLKARLGTRYKLDSIVAESPSMQQVCEMVRRVGPTDTTVMVTGESGTGKEVIARALHNCSRRSENDFLAVNCAALPESLLESEMFGHVKGAFTGASVDKKGLFEAATGGTIFLDEIGSVPLSIQGKLLRVLQEREVRRVGSTVNIPVDARVIAATNSPLEQLIAAGSFREDLYYRLSVIPLELPPLRDRREDILPLVAHFLQRECPSPPPVPSQDVCDILEAYNWPGNIRELENAIKHALTFCSDGQITCDDIPSRISSTPVVFHPGHMDKALDIPYQGKSLKAFLRDKEKTYLQQVLELCNGDKDAAARKLKISLATLYRKLPDEE